MPDAFRVVPPKTFLADLRKIPQSLRRRIQRATETFTDHLFQGRKLEAVQVGQWRLRAGVYRIRYDVIGEDVILHRVRHRKDIYRE